MSQCQYWKASTTKERIKVNSYLVSHREISSKWIKELNLRHETVKLIE